MRYTFYILVAVLIFLGTAAGGLAADEASGIVGTWTTVMPDNAGGQRIFLQVRRDGSYTLYSSVYGSAGKFEVTPPNRWSLSAATTTYSDQGTFRLAGENKLMLTGRLGTGEWRRVTMPPYFDEITAFGQRVPAGVRSFVFTAVISAREDWQSDAIPVMLRVTPEPAGHGPAYFQITLSLYSPSTGAGRQIVAAPYSREVRDIQTGQLSKHPITSNFVDLLKAIEIAHRNGMNGALKEALMLDWPQHGSVWQIHGNGKMYQVAAAGEIVHGDVTGYVAQYNAQWNRAVAGLQKMFGLANLPECPMFTRAALFLEEVQPCVVSGAVIPELCRRIWKNNRCMGVMPTNCAQRIVPCH
jgi:hypothetical protein